jgi:uncharacterized membrane protein YfcA
VGVRALVPGFFTVGVLTASTGAGAVVASPLLFSAGLSGRRYVVTSSVGATSMHVVRIATYSASLLMGPIELVLGLGLALFVALGNLVGGRVATWLDDRTSDTITRIVLAFVVVLGVIAAVR